METADWLYAIGAAYAQGAPTLSQTLDELCRDPGTARRVLARLRSWGGPQAARYRLRHRGAGIAARQIAARLGLSLDDVRPARRNVERELNEFRDWLWAQSLRYEGQCNYIWDPAQEAMPSQVYHYTAEEIAQWNHGTA